MATLFRMLGLLGVVALGTGCGPVEMFPAKTLSGVDRNFDFAAWHAAPAGKAGTKIELGGRILGYEPLGEGVRIVVFQLPIVERPVYGPRDVGKRNGEIVIRFPGKIPARVLAPENKLIVIGTTEAPQSVSVDDVQRSLPSVTAECIHLWLTGRQQISEFPHNIGGGYEPLEESTYCVTRR